MRRPLLYLACVFGFTMAAGSMTAGCGNISEPETYQQFIQERNKLVARIMCTSTFQCDRRPPGQTPYDSEEECRNNIRDDAPSLFNTSSMAPSISRDSGRIVFEPGQAHTCLQKLQQVADSQVCADIGSAHVGLEACQVVLRGQVESGRPCRTGTVECKGALICKKSNNDTCYGQCASPTQGQKQSRIRHEGEACTEPGDFCDPDKNLHCARRDKNGDRKCLREGTLGEGALCDNTSLCEPGLTCVAQSCTKFETVGKGEECNQNRTFCQPGLACIGQADGDEGRKGACRDFSGDGEPCDTTRDCQTDYFCSFNGNSSGMGTCKKLKQLGDNCESGRCDFHLECVPREIRGDSVCRYPPKQSCELPG